MNNDILKYGPVHLDITHKDRSVAFYRDLIGLQVKKDDGYVEMGTDTDTLLVLHPVAKSAKKMGHSGLYHFAIHPQTEAEFARILARLLQSRYKISPTDHTISKAIYLDDPDGITVEITFETPWRFDRYESNGSGLTAIDVDGNRRNASDYLDQDIVFEQLPVDSINKPLPSDTVIGHLHLHVADLDEAFFYYRKLGFSEHYYIPSIQFADLSAGGVFKHRMGVNVWQGSGAPPAPEHTARMRHFSIVYNTEASLQQVLKNVGDYEKTDEGYAVCDPSGTKIILTHLA